MTTPTARRTVLAVMTVGLLLVVTMVWWFARTRPVPAPFTKPVQVDGLDVTVTYIGSECQDGSRLDIDEHPEKVVLTVYTWSDAGSCSDVGIAYELSGRLSSALGTRRLVDGACEMPKFENYGDCQQP